MAVFLVMLRWLRRLALVSLIVLLTVVVGRAFQSRGLPDLKLWHTEVLRSELRARDLGAATTWPQMLAREDTVFRELRERVYEKVPAGDRLVTSRYTKNGPLDPAAFSHDWNRSFALEPETLRGGVLLVHGLTDAPYSVRALAEIFRGEGFYAVAPRMPGHGTVPAALLETAWEDWMAAVRVGARTVRERIGPSRPLYLVGYSNGAALVLKYSLDALADPSLPQADRLLLLSPMIGVNPYAGYARLISRAGVLPYFAKARWIEVYPEYIPFKYNSFPANGAYQTYRLTSALQGELEDASAAKRLARLPPLLAFQSVVDATVSTPALIHGLFDRLPGGTSELVLFDLNRASSIQPFLRAGPADELADLLAGGQRPFRLTLITNSGGGPVREDTRAAGEAATSSRALDLQWPENVFSLSHVALPFRMTDPLYGLAPDLRESFGVRLGLLVPRGERNVLLLPPESSVRLYSNPFFSYVEDRVRSWIATAPAGRTTARN